MKIAKVLFGRPGIYLCIMFLWVLSAIPGEVCILRRRGWDYTFCYLNKYLIPLALSLVFGCTLNLIELFWSIWGRMQFWMKYVFLNSLYAVITFLAGNISFALREKGYIRYVGDGAGSFEMFYHAAIVFYLMIGVPVVFFLVHPDNA